MPNTQSTASTSDVRSERDDDSSATARGAAKVKQTAEQIRGSAAQGVESAWDAVSSAKARASERVHKLSNAVRKIGEHMRIEEQSYIAERANDASQRLDAAADYIADVDLSTLSRDAEQIARQRPALVFGGTFLLGLAAGRFFKGGAEATGTVPSLADRASSGLPSGEPSARRNASSESPGPLGRATVPGATPASTRRPGEGGASPNEVGGRR